MHPLLAPRPSAVFFLGDEGLEELLRRRKASDALFLRLALPPCERVLGEVRRVALRGEAGEQPQPWDGPPPRGLLDEGGADAVLAVGGGALRATLSRCWSYTSLS